MPGTGPEKNPRDKRWYRLPGTSPNQLYFCDLCQVQISCDLYLWTSVISHRTIVTIRPPKGKLVSDVLDDEEETTSEEGDEEAAEGEEGAEEATEE